MLNKLRLFLDLVTAKTLYKSKPIVVHINITNKCNLKCPYCYGLYWGKPNTKDFTTKEVMVLFDELKELGTKRINFGGGEPLLREDIGILVQYSKDSGFVCNMNTNGHLVKEKINVCKMLDSLTISLDGDEKTHDTGKGKGSFKKVMEAIEIAKENGIDVHTSTAITKENIDSFFSVVSLSYTIGFKTEWLLPFFQTESTHRAEQEQYREVIEKLIKYKRAGYPIMTSFQSLNRALNWENYDQKSTTEGNCYAGRFMCIINPDGLVYPCSQMVDTGFPALNFRKVGFREAFENLQKYNTCKSCYAFMAFNDYNLIIDRNLKTIINYAKR